MCELDIMLRSFLFSAIDGAVRFSPRPLHSGKIFTLFVKLEVWPALKPICKLYGRAESLDPAGNRNTITRKSRFYPILSTTLTELSKLCGKPHLQKSSHFIFHWYSPKVVTVFFSVDRCSLNRLGKKANQHNLTFDTFIWDSWKASGKCYSTFCEQSSLNLNFFVQFYILLTVHLVMILGKWPNVAQFFSMYLFKFSTCFEQLRAHHQKNQLYQYNIWYMSLCVGDRPVCRSGRNF